ncbi:MAG: 4Fe-4S binding protein [Armatimonadota bacterium]
MRSAMREDERRQLRCTVERYRGSPGFPDEARMREGPVAVIECVEDIPCNPCEPACPKGAIEVGSPLTNLPRLHAEHCDACGRCIAACPGQAIFVVDLSQPGRCRISLPYERLPRLKKGDEVVVRDRHGRALGEATVLRAVCPEGYDKTTVVTVEGPEEWAYEARAVGAASG